MSKHHFLPGGSLNDRKNHVRFLQEKFPVSQQDVTDMPGNLFGLVEKQILGASEAPLRECGEVFMEHTERDDAGRRMKTYHGDIRAAFKEFLPKKMAVRINSNLANENQARAERAAYGKFIQGHRNK